MSAGQIQADDAMPSVRELAKAHSVNPMTISKSYSMLEAQGLLQRRRGLTMVVAEKYRCAKPAASRLEQLRPTLARAALEAHQLQLPAAEVIGLLTILFAEQEGSLRPE